MRHGYYSVRSKFGQNNSGKGTPDDASRDSLLLQRTEQEQIQRNNVLLQLNEFFVKSIPSGKLLRYNGAIDKSAVAHFGGRANDRRDIS